MDRHSAVDAVRVARFTADHWRRVIMDKFPNGEKWAAHPLCCVLAALDGSTDPTELGLDPEVWDDFKAALNDGEEVRR